MEKVYATASVWTVKMKYWKHIGNKKKEWHFSRCSTSLLFKHLLQMLLKKEACLQLCFPGCRKQYLQTIKCGRNIRLTFTKHTMCQPSQEINSWVVKDVFVLLAYETLEISRTILQQALANRRAYLFSWYKWAKSNSPNQLLKSKHLKNM